MKETCSGDVKFSRGDIDSFGELHHQRLNVHTVAYVKLNSISLRETSFHVKKVPVPARLL